MDDKDKIAFQGQIINEQNQQIDELKECIKSLSKENELLKMDKTDIEESNLEYQRNLISLIDEYKQLIDEVKSIKNELSIHKQNYEKTYIIGKTKLEKLLHTIIK